MVKKAIKKIIYHLPITSKKVILLESSPDFSDNTKYVYDELIRRGVNKDHKIVWLVYDDQKQYPAEKNVVFVGRFTKKGKWYNYHAKYIIDCNRFVQKVNHSQFRIHLTHGACIKRAYDYCWTCGDFDVNILLSDYFLDSHLPQFKGDAKNYVSTGFPRNDGLMSKRKIEGLTKKGEKTIIWMPTYRNHNTEAGMHTGIHFPYGVPCIENKTQLEKLNQTLAKNKVRLIIRLHPAEDRTTINNLSLSNIELYENSSFGKSGEQLYDVLKYTDALITDYSSIYYDYLLLKNPVGLAVPDEKEYTKSYELAEKNYRDFMRGNFIVNFAELEKFIENVAKGKDPAKKDEEWALNRYHKYKDGNSSKRVVDILMKEINK